MTDDMGATFARRRQFLGLAILGAGAALAGATSARAAVPGCDAGDTNAGRVSMRKALEYASPSTTPGKTCAGCAFYTATASAPDCGKCQLLNNGPVAASAVCSSWAPKK